MQMKKIIINADDFGYSKDNNEAIKQGYLSGIITSTSLMANMEGFEDAVFNILPSCKELDIGFHFNIIEGKSLTNQSLLCSTNGIFNRSYLYLIANATKKNFLSQVETEFRAQIEKVLKYCKITHIDSHVHTHAIPEIFNLTVKLAKEYNIKYIRTQKELPYIVWKNSFNTKFPINILKNILLNTFTFQNKKTKILTNDYFIGVLYTGMMSEETILTGLKKIKKDGTLTEIIFHPYLNPEKTNNYQEFLITQNPKFKEELQKSGFVLTNYKD